MAGYGGPEPYYCPEGDGGNSTLTNQDECAILKATLMVPTQTTPLGAEDDSHVDPAFRSADFAGS